MDIFKSSSETRRQIIAYFIGLSWFVYYFLYVWLIKWCSDRPMAGGQPRNLGICIYDRLVSGSFITFYSFFTVGLLILLLTKKAKAETVFTSFFLLYLSYFVIAFISFTLHP